MAGDDELDEADEAVLRFIKSYDFETYGWDTAEAAAELKLSPEQVRLSITRIQRLRRNEVFVYYKEGALHMQTA